MEHYRMEPGSVYPIGATVTETGVNFAIFSAHAEKIELCVFDEYGSKELKRFVLPQREHDIWHGFLKGAKAGLVYGYRVYGPYNPEFGHRFNHHKLLLDPYAKALTGNFSWSERHFAYNVNDPKKDLSFDARDNADVMLKAVVTDVSATLVQRKPIAWKNTVIYEGHVKGLTALNPQVPEHLRGSFLGISHPAMIAHYRAIGITTIELLPVQQFISEQFLTDKKLSNYWGYNSLAFFVPHQDYLNHNQILDFQRMVDELHQAGFEVLIDVVYNHTCEGNRLGPTLSFRGIDNLSYYRLNSAEPRYYINDTGCGNTLNISHPRVLQMVMDSLRYWVQVMGVDGFRFDLATILGRELHGFDKSNGFLDAVLQDPILNSVKMIAEPWDIGPGGYQLGGFPSPWSEWNDRYRDTMRRYWRGDKGLLPEFARRIHGSSDIFEHSGRQPFASINFLCSHDGNTLRDLVSYQDRHNEANGEKNRDGHSDNFAHNYGIEGETSDEAILSLRLRQIKNMMATLMLSQGVPMLLAGDEIGRSQQGNNNAYCQDNEINWLDWDENALYAQELKLFTASLAELRKRFSMLTHDRFIHKDDEKSPVDITWFHPSGFAMQKDHWHSHHAATLGYLIQEKAPDTPVILCLFHAGAEPIEFQLPEIDTVKHWQVMIDTTSSSEQAEVRNIPAERLITMAPFSTIVLLNDCL
ncbi:glycogen debranching protein GlgX [Colwellia sp. MB02u-18]|uniref:glycogen debranching protein GlgX n=1 Tax=unclassified Colwellia TaxID=196834 RepID=UPI0015F44BF5|nr:MULTISPECIES: glycogen debranching protein GlgX [unclassified Colwellia]MBA6222740.1 glycogen debranching protein GlgX [Colwellia sp. MB3u-45]MBA6266053.1 glycogen debranching protein GlgX [Colwellia sp. MB3u-43]MBA6320493.1 glycogen debranching protein GlgX [Colwellia sp. MB02u-19]MBA6323380.1 glycogen debranching protein GlgX [Colwellia sp. MB02u-18]MBA6329878.1 glycogen debranching protein GlgX [Colwellia sp. MB02u-12]